MDNNLQFAQQCDKIDPLRDYRKEFHIPAHNGESMIYFVGNSLGLQPIATASYIQNELEKWAKYGVDGHFKGDKPWYSYHELFSEKTARLVGALPSEVVITHSLTTNLHLLMVSFFRPKEKRTKILCEANAFPSDRYALESQLKIHGLDPKEHLIEISPRIGEYCIHTDDIIDKINELGDQLALLMMGGVNYYTGQLFEMQKITVATHKVGAIAGWDLAHAAGNVELKLHDWNIDFAAWCTYKYLNSSPGGVSGIFVHKKHDNDSTIPRFSGWWGHDKETRFLMPPTFVPMKGAQSWQLSNAPILEMAAHLASLDIFDKVGMTQIIRKQKKLTQYMEFVIEECIKEEGLNFSIITPKEPTQRGAQLSIMLQQNGKEIFDSLSEQGIVADWRNPNVIRIAPVPLYNTFEECFRFGEALKTAINTKK